MRVFSRTDDTYTFFIDYTDWNKGQNEMYESYVYT